MDEKLIDKVMQEVMKRVGSDAPGKGGPAPKSRPQHSQHIRGSGSGDRVRRGQPGRHQGIVIANLDPAIHEFMGFDKKYRSIGIIGGRVGAGPQIMAADDAVKATNTEIIRVEMPRDTKGGAGHGNLIMFGAEDVSDARRAVEVTLEVLPKYFGDVYANDVGYIENQYTARASKA